MAEQKRYGNRSPRPGGGGRRQFLRRKKVCRFCTEKIDDINYKNTSLIGQFISARGKILPRRLTGTCSRHQRKLTVAVKRARNIAMLPFATRA